MKAGRGEAAVPPMRRLTRKLRLSGMRRTIFTPIFLTFFLPPSMVPEAGSKLSLHDAEGMGSKRNLIFFPDSLVMVNWSRTISLRGQGSSPRLKSITSLDNCSTITQTTTTTTDMP
jgi:hypothetical protein